MIRWLKAQYDAEEPQLAAAIDRLEAAVRCKRAVVASNLRLDRLEGSVAKIEHID